jgi:hypothetical protein
MSLRALLDQEALCLFCDDPTSVRTLYRDDETAFEEWGEWEPLHHPCPSTRSVLAENPRHNRFPIRG